MCCLTSDAAVHLNLGERVTWQYTGAGQTEAALAHHGADADDERGRESRRAPTRAAACCKRLKRSFVTAVSVSSTNVAQLGLPRFSAAHVVRASTGGGGGCGALLVPVAVVLLLISCCARRSIATR
jgi:hypothetical protein